MMHNWIQSGVKSSAWAEKQMKHWWQSRYTSWGSDTMADQACCLSKTFRFRFAAFVCSKIQKPFLNKVKENKTKPSICSADESQPVRFARSWNHTTTAIHWLTRQPVTMGTLRWKRAEWWWWRVVSNGGAGVYSQCIGHSMALVWSEAAMILYVMLTS